MMSKNYVRTLIDALGKNSPVAIAVGTSRSNVDYWKRTNKVPPKYWTDLISLAKHKGVSLETSDLSLLYEQPKNKVS